MDSFAQVSRTGLHPKPSAAIRQELSDLLERQLHLHPPNKMASSSSVQQSYNYRRSAPTPNSKHQHIIECINPNVLPPPPPEVPPRPPHLRKHNLSRQMSETNRQLLKEMIEKNRCRRRLSNPGTRENLNRASTGSSSASSSSLVVGNPYTSTSNSVEMVQAQADTAAGANGSGTIALSGDLTRIQVQDVRSSENSTSSPSPLSLRAQIIPTRTQVMRRQNEVPPDTGSPADLTDLIDLTFEHDAPASTESTVTTAIEFLTADTEHATDNLTDSDISTVTAAHSGEYPSNRLRDIAASSQSLDSFLQAAPATASAAAPAIAPNPNTSQSTTSLSSNVFYDGSPGELRVSNKVVWFTPRGTPETGTVKWIGKLKDRYHAGVEFERPVGNSSGLYGGKKLFNCPLTHGRFVPVSELILHIDFYSGSCSNEPSPYSCGIPTDEVANESESKQFGEPPIVCVICQDSLIISASIDDENEDLLAAYTQTHTVSKNMKKNLSKSMDELSMRQRVGSTPPAPVPRPETTNNKEMVATRCGHLFHSDCLSQWFSLKRRLHQPCPYCQHVMHIQDTIRIYPVQGTL